jgi:hypothetical protein
MRRARILRENSARPKVAELESLLTVLQERHKRALANIESRGLTILSQKFTSKGDGYVCETENIFVGIAQDCERQIAAIAKILMRTPDAVEEPAPRPSAELGFAKYMLDVTLPDEDNEILESETN